MQRLQPGQKYIYERSNGVTYARLAGSDPSTRFAIGYEYPNRNLGVEWSEINELAKTNETLKSELDRVLMLYYLLKEEQKNIDHHNV